MESFSFHGIGDGSFCNLVLLSYLFVGLPIKNMGNYFASFTGAEKGSHCVCVVAI